MIGKRRARTVACYVILAGAAFLALFPVIWTLLTSIKSREDTFALPPKFVNFTPTWKNYENLFGTQSFVRICITTVVITLASTFLSVLIGSLSAYALARHRRFLGRRPLEASLIAVRAMPGVVLAVPLFQLARRLHFYDSVPALIVAYTAVSLPFSIWLMTSYIEQIPNDLEECAQVDGASHFTIMRRIVAPLAAPGAAATAIFVALIAWNEFLLPLILASNSGKTLPIFIAGFISARTLDWGPLAAASTLAILPIALLTILMQRRLVSGLSQGALKN